MSTKSLIKNRRFKQGNRVDILYAPLYEGSTIAIADTTAGGLFQIVATMSDNIDTEPFVVGDVCAFSFGVGTISAIATNTITVDFPNSMFPDLDIMRFVGTEYQHVLVFSATDQTRILSDMVVNQYSEKVDQAIFGYAKVVYNLQTACSLKLAPVRRIDDGKLSQCLISKGFVLKSCDTEDYSNNITNWVSDFPIELSGSSIDPIYRRAYLKKRAMTHRGHRAKAVMDFTLIG